MSLRILIVDDVRAERLLLRHALTDVRRDLELREAGGHAEALAIWRAERIDMVFLDVQLAGGSGLLTLDHLQELDPDSFVVMVTQHSTQENVVKALRNGARGFIVKPFTMHAIQDIFARYEREHARAMA